MPDGRSLNEPASGSLPGRASLFGRNPQRTLVLPSLDQGSRCPECSRVMPGSDLTEHLIAIHDYLPFSGRVLPRPVVLTCLWDRVFKTGDPQAQERLGVLLGKGDAQPGQASAYARGLEAELLRLFDNPASSNRRQLEQLVQNLRKSEVARPYYWELVRATDARLRQIGRELLLPDAGQDLQGPRVTGRDVRAWLDRLCPLEDVWDKLHVCQRLPHFGVPRAAVDECQFQLQAERPVACPQCNQPVPRDQLAGHLRKVHRIYQYGGAQRSLSDTIQVLLTAICTDNPNREAWETLEALAMEEYQSQAASFLAARISQTIEALRESKHKETAAAVVGLIAESALAAEIALVLAGSRPRVSRYLALSLTAHLPQPIPLPVMRAIRPMLGRKRGPQDLQVAAAAALFRSAQPLPKRSASVINALLARCGKNQSVERLQQLEALIGPTPIVTERCAFIENRIRMRCPRCDSQLRRPDMAKHLWTQHGLLLDGRRVREPWRLIKDWIKDYRRNGDAKLLVRCRTLGQHLESDEGLQRVNRLVLAYGVRDVEALQILLAEARLRQLSLCPHCYALLTTPNENMPQPLNESRGRLSLAGYCVEVSERDFAPLLTVETPDAVLYRGPEPGHYWTPKSVTLWTAAPLVVAALVLAVALPFWAISPQLPVLGLLATALGIILGIYFWWWTARPLVNRAIDYGWTVMAPQLHATSFSKADSRFLAGLALSSVGRGSVQKRAEYLNRMIRLTDNAIAGGAGSLSHLAALERLAIADRAAARQDPVPDLASSLRRCFKGERPLIFAEQVLAGWQGGWSNPGSLARLRVLLCDRIFEAGLEIQTLIEISRMTPALGAVLDIENTDRLAALRLLWSLRPSRPWDRWSEPILVFDLAADADVGQQLLTDHPDLLLADQRLPPILICCEGIWFESILFTEFPNRVETRTRRDDDGRMCELTLGKHRFEFPTDSAALVQRVERWFRYYFREFKPAVVGVFSWPAPPRRRALHFHEPVECPDCKRLVVPRAGDVGEFVEKV